MKRLAFPPLLCSLVLLFGSAASASAQFVDAAEAAVRTHLDQRTGRHRIAIEGLVRLPSPDTAASRAGYTAAFAGNRYVLSFVREATNPSWHNVSEGRLCLGSNCTSFLRGERLDVSGVAENETALEEAVFQLSPARFRRLTRADSLRVELGPSTFHLSRTNLTPLRKLHEAELDD